jgi:hypothetical protein
LIKPRQSQNRISGFSTESVLKPLILFCDWRGLIKESSRVEPEPSRRFNLLFTVEGSGIQGTFMNEFQTTFSDMDMQNQFNKMSVFEYQIISGNIHKLKIYDL